jgi:hypothetical protein
VQSTAPRNDATGAYSLTLDLRHYYSEKAEWSIALKMQSKMKLNHCLTRSKYQMLDLILLALGLGFFVLAVGYTIACDRL